MPTQFPWIITARIAEFLPLDETKFFSLVSRNANDGVLIHFFDVLYRLHLEGIPFFTNLLDLTEYEKSKHTNAAYGVMAVEGRKFHHMMRILLNPKYKSLSATQSISSHHEVRMRFHELQLNCLKQVIDSLEERRRKSPCYSLQSHAPHVLDEEIYKWTPKLAKSKNLQAFKYLINRDYISNDYKIRIQITYLNTFPEERAKEKDMIDEIVQFINVRPPFKQVMLKISFTALHSENTYNEILALIEKLDNLEEKISALIELIKINPLPAIIDKTAHLIGELGFLSHGKSGLMQEFGLALLMIGQVETALSILKTAEYVFLNCDNPKQIWYRSNLINFMIDANMLTEVRAWIGRINSSVPDQNKIEVIKKLLNKNRVQEARQLYKTIRAPMVRASALVEFIKFLPSQKWIDEFCRIMSHSYEFYYGATSSYFLPSFVQSLIFVPASIHISELATPLSCLYHHEKELEEPLSVQFAASPYFLIDQLWVYSQSPIPNFTVSRASLSLQEEINRKTAKRLFDQSEQFKKDGGHSKIPFLFSTENVLLTRRKIILEEGAANKPEYVESALDRSIFNPFLTKIREALPISNKPLPTTIISDIHQLEVIPEQTLSVKMASSRYSAIDMLWIYSQTPIPKSYSASRSLQAVINRKTARRLYDQTVNLLKEEKHSGIQDLFSIENVLLLRREIIREEGARNKPEYVERNINSSTLNSLLGQIRQDFNIVHHMHQDLILKRFKAYVARVENYTQFGFFIDKATREKSRRANLALAKEIVSELEKPQRTLGFYTLFSEQELNERRQKLIDKDPSMKGARTKINSDELNEAITKARSFFY